VSQQKPRVLVVEDDLSILTGVSMNLRFEGYEVLQAQDGAQGLELAVSDAPDLIVLDVMMPKVNGYEVLRELRSRGVRTPVLVLSAKGMERGQGARARPRRGRLRGEALRRGRADGPGEGSAPPPLG
jgi:CheY-like chemotaxis protein